MIIDELAAIIRRKATFSSEEIVSHLKKIARVATIVQPSIRVSLFSGTQEADNRIRECALTAQADLIVSGDGDLLRLGSFRGIPIVRPIQALRMLPSEPR